ncbi:MAG: hypothetical protein Q8J78_12550 [Moraxellaceae bacterium]|nr:hypothetical protein [Moraxellaceae bacterium]
MNPDIIISHGYMPRTISFHGVHQLGQVSLKLYAITMAEKDVDPVVLDVATSLASDALLLEKPDHPVGFIVAHMAREAIFYLINWWTDENMLKSRAFMAPSQSPADIRSIQSSHIIACVWELRVFAHESSMWIEHVLMPKADTPALYMNQHLEGQF